MSFKTIIGQPLAVDLCQRWLAQGTTHPLLFYGPDGVGKRTTALELAKALNCATAKKPCDTCLSCRKIAAGHHPDVRVLNLEAQALERKEPIEKQHSLRIETVLVERRRLVQSALEGPWKVLILDDAHKLTADAANVLLKVLEEPAEHTALFLLTARGPRRHAWRQAVPIGSGAVPGRESPTPTREDASGPVREHLVVLSSAASLDR